ncbi:MAG TPA: hypothetical protein VK907_06005 [Phnomibacter sp.]|nr:hypothetical protein [Phnomibacter sp.]
MLKCTVAALLALCMLNATAAFVPAASGEVPSNTAASVQDLIRELTVQEFQDVTGKKLTRFQEWQYKRMQKKLNRKAAYGIFPERDELTEGFQALPFFGSILTLGLVWLIMLFTARDRNALRWAGYGVSIIALAATVASLVFSLNGY